MAQALQCDFSFNPRSRRWLGERKPSCFETNWVIQRIAICRWILRCGSDARISTKRSEVRSRDISRHCHKRLTLLRMSALAEGPSGAAADKERGHRQFQSEGRSQKPILESGPLGKKVRHISRVGKPRPQLGDK